MKSKRDAFLEMLDQGMTMMHLDARKEGVDVPEGFKTDFHLRLNFSHRFNLSTFIVEDDRIEADLSFGGTPYLCIIPWDAVFGMTSHITRDFEAWPEDMPTELMAQAEAMAGQTVEESPEDNEPVVVGPAIRRVGHLRVIK